jgi:DNA-binding transcriptional regulator/RsmH inhibitor MraZ
MHVRIRKWRFMDKVTLPSQYKNLLRKRYQVEVLCQEQGARKPQCAPVNGVIVLGEDGKERLSLPCKRRIALQ